MNLSFQKRAPKLKGTIHKTCPKGGCGTACANRDLSVDLGVEGRLQGLGLFLGPEQLETISLFIQVD